DDTFHLDEIDDHAETIERVGFERDAGLAVVAVQITTFAVVVQQSVAEAEFEFAGDTEHISILETVDNRHQIPANASGLLSFVCRLLSGVSECLPVDYRKR